MSFLPLTLGVGRKPDAKGGGRPPSKPETEKILNRDGYTCRFCGFSSAHYQRVVPTSDGYVTACTFCEQVVALERAGLMGGGILIWLPEISQAELNHIARAAYIARDDEDQTDMADAAARAIDALAARRTEAKKRLGTDDPLVLATVLHENLTDKESAAAAKKLDGVRLLPNDKYMVRGKGGDVNGFPQMVTFWRSPQGPFGQIPAASWRDLFAKVA